MKNSHLLCGSSLDNYRKHGEEGVFCHYIPKAQVRVTECGDPSLFKKDSTQGMCSKGNFFKISMKHCKREYDFGRRILCWLAVEIEKVGSPTETVALLRHTWVNAEDISILRETPDKIVFQILEYSRSDESKRWTRTYRVELNS